MASQKTMLIIASKLGLADDEKVISKAAEFERLLQSKSIAGSNLTDTAKVVICLDLAAIFYGTNLDKKSATRYSGLRTPSYTACRKTIENLLELNTEHLTVQTLCLTLQCTGAQSMAERILKDYQAKSKAIVDLSLPQYVCMAVYHASRLKKIKVPKSKLIEKSRLKPTQWTKLDEDWSKFVNEHFAPANEEKGCMRKEAVLEEPNIQDNDIQSEEEKKDYQRRIEPYEAWKKRMLDSAHAELKELQTKERQHKIPKLTQSESAKKIENIENSYSPRRSPRKTPLKFAPYKESPKKPQGVRLLFL